MRREQPAAGKKWFSRPEPGIEHPSAKTVAALLVRSDADLTENVAKGGKNVRQSESPVTVRARGSGRRSDRCPAWCNRDICLRQLWRWPPCTPRQGKGGGLE